MAKSKVTTVKMEFDVPEDKFPAFAKICRSLIDLLKQPTPVKKKGSKK